jgi:uncharacterized MnhB-related membrane protein
MTVLPVTELDIVLAVGLLLVAGLALFLPRRDTAVVMFLVFGVLLAVSWARLNAPDVALAEAAIGAGVTSALLMDAVTYRSPTPTSRSRAGHLLAVLAAGFAGAMAVGLAVVLLQAGAPISPPAGPPHGVAGHLDSAGVSHPVTVISPSGTAGSSSASAASESSQPRLTATAVSESSTSASTT